MAILKIAVCRRTEVDKKRKYPGKCKEHPPTYRKIFFVILWTVCQHVCSYLQFLPIVLAVDDLTRKTWRWKKKKTIILLLFLCPLQDFTSFEVFAVNPALAVRDKALFEIVLDRSGFFILSASWLFALIQGCQARFVLVTVRCPNIDACKFFWTGPLRHVNTHPIIQTNSQ